SRHSRPGTIDPVLFPVLTAARERGSRDCKTTAEGAVIANILRIGVVDVKAETMRHALQQGDLERMIRKVRRIGAPQVGNAAVLGEAYQALSDRQGRARGICIRRSLVEGWDRDTRHRRLRLRHVGRGCSRDEKWL